MSKTTSYMYTFLGVLCVARTLITILPGLNFDLHPSILNGYLLIKLNDVVVLAIWILVSIICGNSILNQYGVLKIGSFRKLFYDVFFNSDDPKKTGLMTALVLILTASSVHYVVRMVYFIHNQWSTELSPLLQSLQIYPALLMAFQSLYQGSYLLKCLVCKPEEDNFDKHHETRKQQLLDHIWLNFTFILHCFCIFVVIRLCTVEPQILWEMVTGEVAYRLFAAFMFWKVMNKIDGFVKADGKQADGHQVVYEQGEIVQAEEEATTRTDNGELVATETFRFKQDAPQLQRAVREKELPVSTEASNIKEAQSKAEMVI